MSPKEKAMSEIPPRGTERKPRMLLSSEGVTLLELTIAVAIFIVAVGAAAQILVSFYATMDVQRQRVVAINHCRSLLSDMRNLRDAFPNSATNPTNFQSAVLAKYPPGTTLEWPAGLISGSVTVDYEDANPTANPLAPTVVVTWRDMRGHTCTISLSSAITDR